jgi:hypothetical protein
VVPRHRAAESLLLVKRQQIAQFRHLNYSSQLLFEQKTAKDFSDNVSPLTGPIILHVE